MNYLEYLIKNHPTRKSNKEKESFRNYVLSEATKLGFDAKTEKTTKGKNENIVIGNPEKAKAVFTAHFDTPASALFPNLMLPRNKFLFYLYQFIPIILIFSCSYFPAQFISDFFFSGENNVNANVITFELIFFVLYFGLFYLLYLAFKNKNNYNDNTSGSAVLLSLMSKLSPEERENAAFIFFDNEEKGKLGSKAYYIDHKDFMENKLLINFDCVGNGKNILVIFNKEAENIPESEIIKESFKENGTFKTYFFPHKGSVCNSDHMNFPKGAAIVACKNTKNGIFYTPNIHTAKDTEADNANIEFLSESAKEFISRI